MAWVGSLGRPGRSFVWVRPPGSLPPWQSLPGVLPRTSPPQTTVLVLGQLRAFWSRGCHWACPVPGHVMPVMAASVAWGGVSAGFLLRAARGAWWSRPGGSRGSGEAATPVTARRFRATGTWGALGDSVNPSDARKARRGRSPNRVFQARARQGKKKLAAPSGPGTCECGGPSPPFFIPRGSSGSYLALQPHLCVPFLPLPIPLAVKAP